MQAMILSQQLKLRATNSARFKSSENLVFYRGANTPAYFSSGGQHNIGAYPEMIFFQHCRSFRSPFTILKLLNPPILYQHNRCLFLFSLPH
jgi:hypothetical protein